MSRGIVTVKWHSLTVEEALHELNVNLEQGLTPEDATQRLQKYGLNELPESPGAEVACAGDWIITLPVLGGLHHDCRRAARDTESGTDG